MGFFTRRAALLEAWISALVALAGSTAFGLTYGFTYGVNNQVAYMLGALRLYDPTVLGNDWYAAHTLNYHPAFAYLGWLLLKIGGPSGWGIGIATVVAASGGAMCVYWLARSLLPRPIALPAFLLTLLAMVATGTRELAISYAFDPIFQPSTVASLALLASMAPFVQGRWLFSGVLLAIAGLFHGNYLLLGLATFGVAHLVLGLRDIRTRAFKHLGPSVLVLLAMSPIMFKAMGGADAALAQHVLFDVRSPFHYHPRGFTGDFFPLMAWHTLGLSLAGWIFARGEGRGRRFAAIVLGLVAVVWIGSALSVVFDVKRVTQIFVFRFAPYVDLLMQLIVAGTVMQFLLAPSAPVRLSRASLGATLASGAGLAIVFTGKNESVVEWLELAAGAAAAGAIVRLALPRLSKLVARVPPVVRPQLPRVAAAGVAVLVWHTVKGPLDSVRARSNLLTGMPGPETDLYTWMRGHTSKDAVFLSPPGLERFRFQSERPIVVDWKASTVIPSELVEWYHRLEDVSGRRGFRGRDDVIAGYDALDKARLESLREKYHLSYAVVSRFRAGAFGRPVVYSNAQWAVLDLR